MAPTAKPIRMVTAKFIPQPQFVAPTRPCVTSIGRNPELRVGNDGEKSVPTICDEVADETAKECRKSYAGPGILMHIFIGDFTYVAGGFRRAFLPILKFIAHCSCIHRGNIRPLRKIQKG